MEQRRLTMTEDVMEETLEDVGPALPLEEDDGEVVHWMNRPPPTVGPLGISATAVGAFTLGVAATLAVLALSDLVDPIVTVRKRRRMRRWFMGRLDRWPAPVAPR